MWPISAELLDQLDRGVGAVVVTEEAVNAADVALITSWLGRQPAWSDLPIVLLRIMEGARAQSRLQPASPCSGQCHLPGAAVPSDDPGQRRERRRSAGGGGSTRRARVFEEVREAEARLRVALRQADWAPGSSTPARASWRARIDARRFSDARPANR